MKTKENMNAKAMLLYRIRRSKRSTNYYHIIKRMREALKQIGYIPFRAYISHQGMESVKNFALTETLL